MLKKKSKYQSKVFQAFEALDRRNAHAVLHFYNSHKNEINQLRFDEAFVLELHYTYALHQTGQYENHLKEADKIIINSIENNIQYYRGEDIYQKTLFQKALSFYHLEDYKSSQHILKELLKLSPEKKDYIKHLKRCLIKKEAKYIQMLQAGGVFISLVAIGILIINILVVEHFYSSYASLLYDIFYAGTIGGGVILMIGLLIQRIKINNKVKKWQKTAVSKRQS